MCRAAYFCVSNPGTFCKTVRVKWSVQVQSRFSLGFTFQCWLRFRFSLLLDFKCLIQSGFKFRCGVDYKSRIMQLHDQVQNHAFSWSSLESCSFMIKVQNHAVSWSSPESCSLMIKSRIMQFHDQVQNHAISWWSPESCSFMIKSRIMHLHDQVQNHAVSWSSADSVWDHKYVHCEKKYSFKRQRSTKGSVYWLRHAP